MCRTYHVNRTPETFIKFMAKFIEWVIEWASDLCATRRNINMIDNGELRKQLLNRRSVVYSATRISNPLSAFRAASNFCLVLETARTRAPRARAAFPAASPMPSEPPIITTLCSVIMR